MISEHGCSGDESSGGDNDDGDMTPDAIFFKEEAGFRFRASTLEQDKSR